MGMVELESIEDKKEEEEVWNLWLRDI